jgi:diguanylate cyclase (GGDEF)-like protein
MTAAAIPSRRLAFALASFCYASVFTAFVVLDRPGLGIGHFFYIPICIVALVGDEFGGICAGVIAALLYSLAVLAAPKMPSAQALTAATGIRLITFTAVGAIVGLYARRNRHLVERLRNHAGTDFVTEVANVRAFDEALAQRCASGLPFSLILLDVDDLRRINDVHGHVAGDAALRQVAAALSRYAERGDFVARVGGDEFALLSAREPAAVPLLAARLNAVLAAAELSVTVAVTSSPADASTGDELLRKADDRLFTAKLQRANRVELTAV